MTESPLELLMACHARIRRYCGGLQALCEVEPGDPRVEATAQSCHRYFGEALHLHAQDEDSSLLPRLQGHLSAPQLEVARQLREQHGMLDAQTPGVLQALSQIAGLSLAERRAVFEPYWTLLLAHIHLEEEWLFPSISKMSQEEQGQIVVEIRARRTQDQQQAPQ